MPKRLDSGLEPPRNPHPRKSARVALNAEVSMRRAGLSNYRVTVRDLSPHGCRVEFVDRPNLDERVWLKFEGLEAIEAMVCWVKGADAGVEFERPVHPAVFDLLISRLR